MDHRNSVAEAFEKTVEHRVTAADACDLAALLAIFYLLLCILGAR